jgi:hypothetical protein
MLMQPIQAVAVAQRIGSYRFCSRFIVLLALFSPQLKGGIWFSNQRCVYVTNSSYDCQTKLVGSLMLCLVGWNSCLVGWNS